MTPTEPTPLAIGCTLSGAGIPVRLREIAALGKDAQVLLEEFTDAFTPPDQVAA